MAQNIWKNTPTNTRKKIPQKQYKKMFKENKLKVKTSDFQVF